MRFLVEYLYNRFVTGFVLKLGGQTAKVLDKGSVELIRSIWFRKRIINLSRNLSKLDTGVVTSYALYILIALVLYVQIPYIYSKDISVVILILYTLFIFINLFIHENKSLKNNNGI